MVDCCIPFILWSLMLMTYHWVHTTVGGLIVANIITKSVNTALFITTKWVVATDGGRKVPKYTAHFIFSTSILTVTRVHAAFGGLLVPGVSANRCVPLDRYQYWLIDSFGYDQSSNQRINVWYMSIPYGDKL
jgi:hypothetical protein